MKTCPNCGADLRGNPAARFCPRCGAPLPAEQPVSGQRPPAAPPKQAGAPSQPRPKKKGRAGLIAAVIILAVLAASFGVFGILSALEIHSDRGSISECRADLDDAREDYEDAKSELRDCKAQLASYADRVSELEDGRKEPEATEAVTEIATETAAATEPATEAVLEEPELEGTHLSVVTSFESGDGNAQKYNDACMEFENTTGVIVDDFSPADYNSFQQQVLEDFQTGSEPDVLYFYTGEDARPFIEADQVVSVEEIREKYPEYASNMKDQMLPASPVNDRQYAIPVSGYWESLYCNTAVLKAAGVEVPGPGYTWDQFLDDCQKIRDAGYVPIAASLGEVPHYWWEFSIFNHNSPETHLEIPASTHSVNGPSWVSGMEDLRLLYELGNFPESTLTATDNETFQLFTEGKAAFLLDGSWRLSSIVAACCTTPGDFSTLDTEKLDTFDVVYFPGRGDRRATDIIGGMAMGYYISRSAWNDPARREAAVRFVEHMTSDEVVSAFAAHSVTALKTASDDSSRFNSLQRRAMAMVAGATSLTSPVQDIFTGDCRIPTFDGLPLIVTGQVPAVDAVEEGLKIYAEQNR